MVFEQKDGYGALFKNAEKEKETHADYQGSIKVGGVEYFLDAWLKSSKDGKTKYMSLSAKPKMARDHRGGTANPPARKEEEKPQHDFDDQIPF